MNDFENKLFVINKLSGPTSFDVVEAFRKVSRIRRVGHAGTLDPLAAGVLLICTGRATRAVEHFMNLSKRYEFEVRLGVGTTTLDAEGDVTSEVPCPRLETDELLKAAESFVGEYVLDPPAFSAIKKNGKRLYELARLGQTPKVEGRKVTIHEFEVVRVELPNVHFRLKCSRGTYARSLARDFGARFGLPAHILHLVRTAIGSFDVGNAFPSDRLFAGDTDGLEGRCMSDSLDFLPGIVINNNAKRALMNGVLPGERDVVKTVGLSEGASAIRILDGTGELLAVGTRSDGARSNRLAWVDSYRLFVDERRLQA